MVNVSSAFHNAIREDENQLPLFLFDDAVVSSQDIEISASGIRFSENAVDAEDYAPGSCISSTLGFDLLNEHNEWSAYGFGQFRAYLGVRTAKSGYTSQATCYLTDGVHRIEGYDTAPYLRLDGVGVSGMTEPVGAMALFEGKLVCFTRSSWIGFAYDGRTLTRQNFPLYAAPILRHAELWKAENKSFVFGYRCGFGTAPDGKSNLVSFSRGESECFELCPLGIFIAEKPVFSSLKTVAIDAYDRMSLLDKDYEKGKVHFPCNIQSLVTQIAAAVGITIADMSGCVNTGETLQSEPEDFEDMTWREILSDCAEITGTFAKMNRYGQLELRWFRRVGMTLTEHDYSTADFGYYHSAPVDKVVLRKAGSDDVVSGSGDNALYIQGNKIMDALTGGGNIRWPQSSKISGK